MKKNIKPVLCLFSSLGNSLLNEPCYLLSQDSKYPLYKQLLLQRIRAYLITAICSPRPGPICVSCSSFQTGPTTSNLALYRVLSHSDPSKITSWPVIPLLNSPKYSRFLIEKPRVLTQSPSPGMIRGPAASLISCPTSHSLTYLDPASATSSLSENKPKTHVPWNL